MKLYNIFFGKMLHNLQILEKKNLSILITYLINTFKNFVT